MHAGAPALISRLRSYSASTMSFPRPRRWRPTGEQAFVPLRQWRRDHAADTLRFPALMILRMAAWAAEDARVRAIQSPVAGTYRLELLLPSGDSLTFFARTALRPTFELEALTQSELEARWRGPLDHCGIGYYLVAQTASSLAELTHKSPDRHHPPMESYGHVAVVETPALVSQDSTVWAGWRLRPDQTCGAVCPTRRPPRQYSGSSRNRLAFPLESSQLTYAPGHFVRRADGSMRYTLTVRRDGRHVLSVRGERVSRDVLGDP